MSCQKQNAQVKTLKIDIKLTEILRQIQNLRGRNEITMYKQVKRGNEKKTFWNNGNERQLIYTRIRFENVHSTWWQFGGTHFRLIVHLFTMNRLLGFGEKYTSLPR